MLVIFYFVHGVDVCPGAGDRIGSFVVEIVFLE